MSGAAAGPVPPKASTAGAALKSQFPARAAASLTFTNVIQGADAATMVSVLVVCNGALLAGKGYARIVERAVVVVVERLWASIQGNFANFELSVQLTGENGKEKKYK